MPLVSQAQARWAYANQSKAGQEGAAAREFISASPSGPGSVNALPARVHLGKPVGGKLGHPDRSRAGKPKPIKPFGSLVP